MSKVFSVVQSFIADENGVTAIEYGLIAALVGVAVVAAAGKLGDQLNATFNAVVAALVPAAK